MDELDDAADGHEGRRAHRVEDDHQAHRRGAKGRRGAELRVAQAPARIRRRDEQAARGGTLTDSVLAAITRDAGIENGKPFFIYYAMTGTLYAMNPLEAVPWEERCRAIR